MLEGYDDLAELTVGLRYPDGDVIETDFPGLRRLALELVGAQGRSANGESLWDGAEPVVLVRSQFGPPQWRRLESMLTGNQPTWWAAAKEEVGVK